MIPREKGEIVEMIVIGELAKIGIHTARPLSDIFPFDLIPILDVEHQYDIRLKYNIPKGKGNLVQLFDNK